MTVIASNTSALRAQNASNTANKGLSQAMERLSSGKRINSAKDDAAGLAIVTKMNAEVRGMTAARRNANDGISLAQTAEGALGDVSNMLTRMKELAVQATNGTNGTEAKANIQKEVDALITQIGEVGKMKFNGVDLFSATATKIQTGTGASDQVSITTGALTTTGLGIATLDVSTTASFAAIDDAISKVSTSRADMGAVQSRLDSAASNLTSTITNLSDAASRIQDADFSEESTALAKNQILTQASTAMLAQANQSQQGVLSLLR